MATYTIDFNYSDGDCGHYEAETEQSVKNMINFNLGRESSLTSIIITVEKD